MQYTFKCPLPPTLNDQIAEARGNKYRSAATKKKWTAKVAEIVKDAPVFEGKIWIACEWYVKNFARDGDNIMASMKYIMDGLEDAKIVKNDNLTIIQSPQLHSFAKDTADSVVITLSDRRLFEVVWLP